MALHRVKRFTPFDPVIKRTEAVVDGKDGEFQVAKGAPQVVLELAANREKIHDQVNQDVEGMAKLGYRSLGVIRNDGEGWKFLGIIGLQDRPVKIRPRPFDRPIGWGCV